MALTNENVRYVISTRKLKITFNMILTNERGKATINMCACY